MRLLWIESSRRHLPCIVGGVSEPTADTDRLYRKVMDITDDPLPYGVEPNRRMIEAIIRHAGEQGILPRPFALEELFARETLELAA